ncbi:hypothetical protein V1521DRAFT_423334 [Lipomyces starkeyi]
MTPSMTKTSHSCLCANVTKNPTPESYDNGLVRQKEARSTLCDCPWKVRFKKQLNDTWVVTQLVDYHEITNGKV